MTTEDVLTQLGLCEREVALYLMLLSVGTSPASTLAQRTGMTRSTAQYNCQQLVKKGFAMLRDRNGLFFYTAEPPEKLFLLLKKNQESLHETEENLHRIVGSLKGMMNVQSVLPKVRFFEGAGCFRAAYDVLLQKMEKGTDMVGYAQILIPHEPHGVEEDVEFFVQERKRLDVKLRLLIPDVPHAAAFHARSPSVFRETRIVNEKYFPKDPAEILLYKDSMYIFSAEKDVPFVCVVQSDTVVRMHMALFAFVWEHAPVRMRKATTRLPVYSR